MTNLKQRIARRLHHIAWRLDPLPTSTPLMAYTTDAPMTDATAKVIADAVSHQSSNIGLHYRNVDGSKRRTNPMPEHPPHGFAISERDRR